MGNVAQIDLLSEAMPSDEARVDYYLSEVKQLQAQMDEDQQEIERMQVQTRAILANIMNDLAVPAL
jgi:hypothetical protein